MRRTPQRVHWKNESPDFKVWHLPAPTHRPRGCASWLGLDYTFALTLKTLSERPVFTLVFLQHSPRLPSQMILKTVVMFDLFPGFLAWTVSLTSLQNALPQTDTSYGNLSIFSVSTPHASSSMKPPPGLALASLIGVCLSWGSSCAP